MNLFNLPKDGQMNLKAESTAVLHETLKKIANVNNIMLKGMFPGMAFLDIKEGNEYLKTLHESYFEEFKGRIDATMYEPNIHKIGTAEFVNE